MAQRYGFAAYDAGRGRLVEFGGRSDFPLSQTRALDLGATDNGWALFTTSNPPPARTSHCGAYDPRRNRLVIFGGYSEDPLGPLGDLWALDLSGSSAWSQLPAGSALGTVYATSAACDSANDRLLLFGGVRNGSFSNELWEYPLGSASGWQPVPANGELPPRRAGHASILDPVRHRLLVLGGAVSPDPPSDTDVWSLPLAGAPVWTHLAVAGSAPPLRVGISAVYDPDGDRVLMFGGYDNVTQQYSNEVWALSLSGVPTWTKLTPAGLVPPARFYASAIWDPHHGRLLVTGGDGSRRDSLGGVWALTPSAQPAWTPLLSAALPLALFQSELAADSAGDQVLLYTRLSVWSLRGNSTSLVDLKPAGSTSVYPFESSGWEQMLFDAGRRALLVFDPLFPGTTNVLPVDSPDAGWTIAASGSFGVGEGWPSTGFDPALDRILSASENGWMTASAETLAFSPPSIQGSNPFSTSLRKPTLAVDPIRHVAWIVCGTPLTPVDTALHGVTMTRPFQWTQMPIAEGPRPAKRYLAGVTWDSRRGRILLFGGCGDPYAYSPAYNDLWELRVRSNGLTDSLRWVKLVPAGPEPPVFPRPAIAYDAVHDCLLVHGGNLEQAGSEILWQFRFSEPVTAVEGPPAEPLLTPVLQVRPNPVAGSTCRIEFGLPRRANVNVRVFDCAGRCVLRNEVGHLLEGRHELTLPGFERLASGLYIVELLGPERLARARVLLIH